jgi:nucleotide-binding universal stress UspA family protein
VSQPVILVPLDGSEHALVALPVAKGFSEIEGATLHIIHVADHKTPPMELLGRVGLEPAELRGATIEAKTGEPATMILDAARETKASLIVMCTHTAPAKPGQILGRTAFGVLLGASCPVVLVHPERDLHGWRLHRILLPHDGSPAPSAALRSAAEFARRVGTELVVLLVAATGTPKPRERGSLTTPFYLDQPQHEWPAWAHEFIERLACLCPLDGLRVRLILAHGRPEAEIVRAATEHSVDLIVLAWRGEWGPEHAETLKAVVREAPCPTMVARV